MIWQNLKDCFHLSPGELDADYPNWRSYPFQVWFLQEEKVKYCSAMNFPKFVITDDADVGILFADVQRRVMHLTDEQLKEGILVEANGRQAPVHDISFHGEFPVLVINL